MKSIKHVVTSKDVAKMAGVSQSTVSRVFVPGSSVSEKTKQKVFEAAKALNYRPNAFAR
ncbi:LacI family DNA-binding transcriptional regulator, partial [Vibrio alginolyticus]